MLDREVPFGLTLLWLAGLGGMGLGWLLTVDWSIDNSHNQYNSDVEWLSALLQRHLCLDGLLAWFLTGGGTARVQARKKRLWAAMKDVCRVGDVSSLATAVGSIVVADSYIRSCQQPLCCQVDKPKKVTACFCSAWLDLYCPVSLCSTSCHKVTSGRWQLPGWR